MSTIEIAKILKELRLKANMSQKQAYEHIGVAQSTFSSWETGKAEPPNEVLLRLCKLYGVTDILAAFGFDGYNKDGSIQLNINEIEHIQKYRSLDGHGKDMVGTILDKEYQRCQAAPKAKGQEGQDEPTKERSIEEIMADINKNHHFEFVANGTTPTTVTLTPEEMQYAMEEYARIMANRKK